jgi:hypothetical protein
MSMKFKPMIMVNAFLGLFYVVSSYWIWAEINKWVKWNIAINWTPFLVYPYRNPDLPQIQMPTLPLWNFPFILFLVIIGVNVYFIVRLQKNRETKPAELS